jgi:hypothetical protein
MNMKLIPSKSSRNAKPLQSNAHLVDGYLSESISATLEELRQHAWQTDGAGIPEGTYNLLKRLQKMRSALASLTAQSDIENARHFTYLISASFLKSSYRTLTKTCDEDLVYATGPDDGTRVCALTRLVTFELAQRSMAYAAPEFRSQLQALKQLDENKERLLATFHSHTGIGPGWTKPSGTDMSTQQGLEKNGYPAIGVVFSSDGYVRFYSVNRPFRVTVSGAGVRQIDDCLFQITDKEAQPSGSTHLHPKSIVNAIEVRAKALLSRRSK